MYRYRYVAKQVEIFLWRLIHKNFEAERSHNLLSANERTRKASGAIPSESGSPRTRSTTVQRQEKISQLHPSSVFLFYSGLQWIGCCQPILLWVIFTQSADSNANLFWKLTYRHTQKSYLPVICGSFSPIKMIHKINHHITLVP